MRATFNQPLPDHIRDGQRITGMTSGQKVLPVCPSKYKFTKQENNDRGVWVSELLPHTATVAKELCVVHTAFTEAIKRFADPEILARIRQHEMAYHMQTSVPELMDVSSENDETIELYGEQARKPETFAACCLNARRLVERGVRNIQIFHRGWDAHGNLPREHESQCKDVDQGSGRSRWSPRPSVRAAHAEAWTPTSARYRCQSGARKLIASLNVALRRKSAGS